MSSMIGSWIINNISAFGYTGIVVLMALESANIPIPSEVTLPFAGYLVSQGQLNFHVAALAGAFGCLAGSIPSYWLGRKLGRPFLDRYGKWFFLSHREIALGDRWMRKYGDSTAFFSRLLPIVRTFISFIAGVWEAPFWAFALLSFLGSWIWSYALIFLGVKMGENWASLQPYWERFNVAIIALILGAVLGYAWFHWKEARKG